MRAWRYILVALAASALTVGALAGTGFADRRGTANRYLNVRIGDNLVIKSVDLFCIVLASDPDHHEAGPIVYCKRRSVPAGQNSRSIGVTRYHYQVGDPTGSYTIASYTRARRHP
jgi:hypothetical protein